MIDWTQFHFLRPLWLAALLPLAILMYLVATRRVGSRGWAAVCDAALLPHILIGQAAGRHRAPLLLAAACGVLAILAMAGPAWNRLPQPLFSSGQALVIALDLSRSMDATDLSPSRAGRARYKVKDILEERREGLSALVVYAGDAFTVAPLTDDVNTIIAQLPALSTDIMPAQGSRADVALELAGSLLRGGGQRTGEVLLITDEVDAARDAEAAAKLRAAGYRVSVLAVATSQGGPIVREDGSYLKDSRGEIVIPVLEEGSMRSLAEAGGGEYLRLSLDDADVKRLSASMDDRPMREEGETTSFRADLWEEKGPWLVLALLPLAALWFRRGYLFVLLVFLVPVPRPAQAAGWDDLWLRPDQQAHRALEQGDNARAAELFERDDWKGAAQYRAKDYTGADESLAHLKDADSLYNRGNALARLGRLEEAIAAYDKSLKADPANEDALYNKKLLEEELKKQRQQQQQQGGQEQQEQQAGEKGSQDQQQSAGSQSQAAENQSGSPENKDAQGNPEQDTAANPAAEEQREESAETGESENKEALAAEKSEEEKEAAEADTEAAQLSQREKDEVAEESGAVASSDELPQPSEEQQAMEQWLRRIPDDPAGLLRRKFQYQYQQRQAQPQAQRPREEQSW